MDDIFTVSEYPFTTYCGLVRRKRKQFVTSNVRLASLWIWECLWNNIRNRVWRQKREEGKICRRQCDIRYKMRNRMKGRTFLSIFQSAIERSNSPVGSRIRWCGMSGWIYCRASTWKLWYWQSCRRKANGMDNGIWTGSLPVTNSEID